MHALEQEIRRALALAQPSAAEEAWLVYADWLSSRDDPRGRWIALEHRAASATLEPGERERLRAEIDALLAEHRPSWTIAGLPDSWTLEWQHGFVVGVSLPLDDNAIAPLERLLAEPSASLLTRLRVRVEGDEDEEFDFFEEFDGELPERPPVDAAPFLRLLELDLARIGLFAFEYTPLGVDAIAGLVASELLAGLTTLDLRFAGAGDDAIALLAGAPGSSGLATLNLQRNRIGPRGAAALAESAALSGLRHLDLRDNPLGSAGAKALARGGFGRLESLYVYRRDVEREGALALAAAEHLPLSLRRYWAGQASASTREDSNATAE